MNENEKNMSKYQILSSYIKDISFEVPTPACFIDANQNLDKYNTTVDITTKPGTNQFIELNCKITFHAPENIIHKIHVEACIAVIIKILDENLSKEQVRKLLLVEIPDLHSKHLTGIITDMLHKSGFKDFKFSKEINFAELFLTETTNQNLQKN